MVVLGTVPKQRDQLLEAALQVSFRVRVATAEAELVKRFQEELALIAPAVAVGEEETWRKENNILTEML